MSEDTCLKWHEFPALLKYYDDMLNYITEVANSASISEKKILRLQFGFEEAVVNIINYAYTTSDKNDIGPVWICSYVRQDRFTIELKDCGVKFNPLLTDDALDKKPTSLEETKIGGLGISFMMREFDDVSYDYYEENGVYYNHLKLSAKIK